jgi:hypothetical protein
MALVNVSQKESKIPGAMVRSACLNGVRPSTLSLDLLSVVTIKMVHDITMDDAIIFASTGPIEHTQVVNARRENPPLSED